MSPLASWAPCRSGSEPPGAPQPGRSSLLPLQTPLPRAPDEKMLPAARSRACRSANSLKARLGLLATPARQKAKIPSEWVRSSLLPSALCQRCDSAGEGSQRLGTATDGKGSLQLPARAGAALLTLELSWAAQSTPAASPALGKATGEIPAGAKAVKVQPWS